MRFHRLTWPLIAALLCLAPALNAHDKVRQPPKHEARLIRFPDTAEYQTLVVDLHTHSVFSDGHVWPGIRVEEALRDGLDGLAITEHLEWQPHRGDLPHPDRNRAFEEAVESLPEGSDLIVIPGAEVTREDPAGHMNAVFLSDANALLKVEADSGPDRIDYYRAANAWPAEEAVRAANEQGAFVFWNHPFWPQSVPDGVARMTDFHAALIEAGQLHGIEIANGATYSEEAHRLAIDHELALIGVSDVHDLVDWDYPPAIGAHRPVTLVFAEERSAAGIREALFAQRTVVWFKNLLVGREAVLKPLLQAALDVQDAAYRKMPDIRNPGGEIELAIVDLTLTNISDADVHLRNRSPYTFTQHADEMVIPAHDSLRLSIRTREKVPQITIDFEFTNALVAPKTPLRMQHLIELKLTAVEQSEQPDGQDPDQPGERTRE